MSFSVTVRWPGMTDGELEEFGTDAHDLAKWLFGIAGSRWQRARIRWWGWGDLVDVLVLPTIDDADVAWMPFDRVEAVMTSFRVMRMDPGTMLTSRANRRASREPAGDPRAWSSPASWLIFRREYCMRVP